MIPNFYFTIVPFLIFFYISLTFFFEEKYIDGINGPNNTIMVQVPTTPLISFKKKICVHKTYT
uniref:Uncharacterized protein n=1 Tax=Lepeophtheirus salmonis TaxID=72036 RepID=A0A0K2UV13_LEPSM